MVITYQYDKGMDQKYKTCCMCDNWMNMDVNSEINQIIIKHASNRIGVHKWQLATIDNHMLVQIYLYIG